MKDKDLILFI